MRSSHLLLPALALLVPSLSAQVVSPAHFTSTEGNGVDTTGVGDQGSPHRYLQVHNDLKGTARTINSVAFRRDGAVFFALAFGAMSSFVDIHISTAATLSSAPMANFDANHGGDKAQVAAFKQISWAATNPGSLTRPFEYVMPFNQPFPFAGANGLCWELRVNSRTSTTASYLDYVSGSNANPPPDTFRAGTGCRASTYVTTQTMSLTAGGTGNWAASSISFTYTGNFMPKSGLVLLAIGISDKVWNGIPLPVALPGTDTAPSGVCTVYNDWLIQLPTPTTATGTLTQSLGFPVQPSYNGASLFTQAVALDPAANFYGVVMSNLTQHHVVAPYPVTPIGNVWTASLAATGAVRANGGYVTLFQ